MNPLNFFITFNSFSVKNSIINHAVLIYYFLAMGFTTTCPSASIYKPIHNLEILSQAKFLKYVDSMTDLYNKGVRPET